MCVCVLKTVHIICATLRGLSATGPVHVGFCQILTKDKHTFLSPGISQNTFYKKVTGLQDRGRGVESNGEVSVDSTCEGRESR